MQHPTADNLHYSTASQSKRQNKHHKYKGSMRTQRQHSIPRKRALIKLQFSKNPIYYLPYLATIYY